MKDNVNNIKQKLTELASKLPPWLRGMKGAWLTGSILAVVFIALSVLLALKGRGTAAIILASPAVVILVGSNFWFRARVSMPVTGLTDTAKRISAGSYGTLAEKRGEDEIGELTDAINDMSVKIGAASKTQTDFVSSVSHELRTPLTAITGWSETLLYDDAIQGDSRRGVEIISKESGRLTNMVEELLEFTRIRDGRFTLNMESVDVCAEMEDVVFTYGGILKHEDMDLVFSQPDEDLPPITGDPRRLKQVILNILDNAGKYARGSKVELSVARQNEYIVISIRDHGPGIPQKDLPHVKEKFYKGSSKERGSGIGLSVCDEIVTRHGGKLSITNAEDGGALVTVSLPVQTQQDKR